MLPYPFSKAAMKRNWAINKSVSPSAKRDTITGVGLHVAILTRWLLTKRLLSYVITANLLQTASENGYKIALYIFSRAVSWVVFFAQSIFRLNHYYPHFLPLLRPLSRPMFPVSWLIDSREPAGAAYSCREWSSQHSQIPLVWAQTARYFSDAL